MDCIRPFTLLITLALCAIALPGCCGKWARTCPAPWARTFVVQEMTCGKPTRGHPFLQYEMQKAVATWARDGNMQDTYTTVHVTSVPKLMTIDAERALLGTTEAAFTNNPDGTLLSSSSKVDQKIPEIISAVGDVMKSIPAGTRGRPECAFAPDLKPLQEGRDILVSLRFMPLNCEEEPSSFNEP